MYYKIIKFIRKNGCCENDFWNSKIQVEIETLPKPFSRESNFWKVGTIFGIPKIMEIFQKLFSRENCFGEVLKFKGIFGIADKSLEEWKSIFGIPKITGIFQKLFSRENCFGEVLKFKGIFGIADKSLEEWKSIFGIPKFR